MLSRTFAMRNARPARAATIVLVALLVLSLLPMASRPAEAISINVVYDSTVPGAVDPCVDKAYPACNNEEPLTDEMMFLVQVAAAYWATIFQDSHLYDIRVAWVIDSLPSAQTTNIDANGRPTAAIVRVPANTSFWYDPTPFDDEEFDMQPRLYRDTHPAEQAEAFKGDVPDVFEVGYNGPGQGNDLLTILLHELGHAIGLNANVAKAGRNPSCLEDSNPYYDLDADLLGGADMSLKAYEIFGYPSTGDDQRDPNRRPNGQIKSNPQSLGFDCSHLALGGIDACNDDKDCEAHQALQWFGMLPKARSRPSIADILAIATAAGWNEIHLPRKYSLDSGNWTNGATWLGLRVPNAGNNVYIVNRDDFVEIDLYELGQARDVLISDGNRLNVTFGRLDAYRVTMSGEDSTLLADSGAFVDVVYLTTNAGAMLDLANGSTVDAFWTVRNDGLLRGGGDSVVEAHTFDNRGVVRANGGNFTVRASHDGPALDLDGASEWPFNRSLEALAGNLIFDGVVKDPINAAVKIGPGFSVSFEHGWQQSYTGDINTALSFDGKSADAVVHGDTIIGGYVVVDGRGRFTSPVVFQPWGSRTQIDIDGLTAVSDYDQIVFEQSVEFNGALDLLVGNDSDSNPGGGVVVIAPGFEVDPGDEFVIMTYASHSGQFAEINGWDRGSLRLYPEYGANELRIVVRLVGDMNGDGALTNADKSGLAQAYGVCEPNPVPCVGDINEDGVIDQNDMHLLDEKI